MNAKARDMCFSDQLELFFSSYLALFLGTLHMLDFSAYIIWLPTLLMDVFPLCASAALHSVFICY